MPEDKKKRFQFTKAEKRVLAEETTKYAFSDELKRKAERDLKTQKLRAMRLEKQRGGGQL